VSESQSDPDFSREVPLGELLRRLAQQGTALGESRLDMARSELSRDLGAQIRRVGVYAAATLLVVFGLQFLVVAGVLALATQLGGWLASLLVSILCLIAGTALLLFARSRAASPFLKRTFEALGEDLQWLRTLAR
jgi:uncharacterized membrane protein YqjE